MKNLQYFLILLFSNFSFLLSEQLPGMKVAQTIKPALPTQQTPVASVAKPIEKPIVAVQSMPVVAKPIIAKPVVTPTVKPVAVVPVPRPVVAQPVVKPVVAKPIVAAPVAKPFVQVQQAPVVQANPAQAMAKSVVISGAPSFTKLPLQINIKNNATITAHITGFSVVYQAKTIQSNMYLALEPGEEKHYTFNLKIPNDTNQTVNYPYVSNILVDGQTVPTNYQKTPIGHTLQVLQITKKKNGLWALDAKAMKKAKEIVPAEGAVDQSSLREGIVTTVAQTRATVAKKTNKKSVKKSKSSQSGKKL